MAELKTPQWNTLLCGFAFWVLATSAHAHPFHTTTAEMEFNSTTGRFEVSLKIHATDIEAMLRSGDQLLNTKEKGQTKATSVEPKTTEQRQAQQLARYLERQFVVTVAGKPCQLEWIGSEDDQASKWLYFELVLPDDRPSSGEMTLTNKVLCDHNNNQINTVVFLSKTARVSLKTHEHAAVVNLPRIE